MHPKIKFALSIAAIIFLSAPIVLISGAFRAPRDPSIPVRKAESLMARIYPGSVVRVVCTLPNAMETVVTCTVGREGSDPISLRCPTGGIGVCYLSPAR